MTPTQFAADGYDCVYAIYQALEAYASKNGGLNLDDMEYADLCEILIGEFTDSGFSVDGLTGKNMHLVRERRDQQGSQGLCDQGRRLFRSVIQSGPSERKPNKGGCLFCAGSSLSAIFSRQSSERCCAWRPLPAKGRFDEWPLQSSRASPPLPLKKRNEV